MAKRRGVKAFEAAERQIKEQKKQKQVGARLARMNKEKVGRLTCQDNPHWVQGQMPCRTHCIEAP